MPDCFALVRDGDLAGLRQALADDPAAALRRNEQGLSPLTFAVYCRRFDAAESILAAGYQPDFHELCLLGRIAEVRRRLAEYPAAAASVSADGFTALHYAAFFGKMDVAQALLEAGANVEAVAANPTVVRPLHSACAAGNREIAALLLARGADPNAAQQMGFRPLHSAANLGDVEMIRALLAAGADASLRDDSGKSPRDIAAAKGHAAAAEALAAP